MPTVTSWKGTETQMLQLVYVLMRHCGCQPVPLAAGSCPAHRMLTDQRVLDGLLFGRYMAQQLIEEEFRPRLPLRAPALGPAHSRAAPRPVALPLPTAG
jgi:hypothetical protein